MTKTTWKKQTQILIGLALFNAVVIQPRYRQVDGEYRRSLYYSLIKRCNRQFLGFSSIVLLLMASSGFLFYENQHLQEELVKVTHAAEILDAEVPDPVFKYAPLLVGKDEPRIKELAASLGSPEDIYLFVRDEIEYSENYDKRRTAIEVLESGQGDCLGQADLLAALLLAYGYTEEEVHVDMGYTVHNGEKRHHAWVEFEYKSKWMVLDASRFMGTFEFEQWERESFYHAFQAQPYAEFNDEYVHVNLRG